MFIKPAKKYYNKMGIKSDDSGITENLGSILMIFVLLVVALVATLMVTGVAGDTLSLEKPKFAMFKVDTVMGYGRSSHAVDTPVIKISELGGDDLEIRYKEGTHSGLSGTKLYLFDPNGEIHEITQSVTMEGGSITSGENFYIFSYVTNPSEGNIWITNDIGRITDPKWGGVAHFTPSGKWRVLIVDEDNTGIVLLDREIDL